MPESWRQAFHLEPPQGWLNDPNGLCFYQGLYHVFFQYCPESASGKGRKCWGHYTSRNLRDWSFLGTALQPDCAADRDGVYSGCAVPEDERMLLFYTGNVKQPGDFDYISAGREGNVILVESADGQNMGEKRVLLRNRDYPADCSCHVRDPKVYREDGVYRMVLGARSRDDRGRVLLYESADSLHWRLCSVVQTKEPFGYMWECPDFFRLSEKAFLSVSPQGLRSEAERYQNVYASGYFPVSGPLAGDSLGSFEEWDHGFDFYAPQTFLAADGRRLLIGWMGMPDAIYKNLTEPLGWQHCLTVPRELFLDAEGRLCQRPARELDALFAPGSIPGESVRLPMRLHAETAGSFSLTLGGGVTLLYSCAEGLATLRFTDDALGGGRTVRRARLPRCRTLDLLADNSSLEIYLDGGAVVFSTRFYPGKRRISLRTEGIEPILQAYRPPRGKK